MQKNFSLKKTWCLILLIILTSTLYGGPDIIIENSEMRLIISEEGYAKSLIHKATGQECLNTGESIPVFELKRYDRQELHLLVGSQPLPSERVQKKGDKLIISFKNTSHVVTLHLTITDSYIGFTVDNVEDRETQLSQRLMRPLDELVILRLPVRERDHFGEWLNVMHDKEVAVNLLATDHYCNIDYQLRSGYRIMEARAVDEIKTLGVGAALIVTETNNLLDRIEQLETDYNLPPGVKNRRREEQKYSYYWAKDITPANVDNHIKYAQAGGFKMFVISCTSFSIPGHFTWLPSYSNGMQDLKSVVDKIHNAGIIPGIHLFSTKADKRDDYVTGIPDNRLGLSKIFTLAEPITEFSGSITVEENPRTCTMQDGRRILKIGEELIAYEGYTTERPFQFTGCERGHLQTKVFAREKGFKFGLLDVDTWIKWVRFDQQTSIQQEVAERIGEIYNQAGFRFIYLDGAEDVNPPYWYNMSYAQKIVIDQLYPPPILAEAAVRTHFSWHMLDRANAFDLQMYPPEDLKDATRRQSMQMAVQLQDNFTRGDFGWFPNYPPGHIPERGDKRDTIGVQPDMIEFSTSRAAGWNTGTSLWTQISWSDPHPRTKDIFEVFNRWETVRERNWLSEEQKSELQDPYQEHILLLNENKEFELRPYYQITRLPTNEIRAFHFQREGKIYVAYWHTLGEGQFSLPVKVENVRLFDSLDGEPLRIMVQEGKVVLPAGGRRYLEFTNLPQYQIIEAFRNLQIEK